jgi:MFS family permease
MAMSTLGIGEQTLLLRYSDKHQREANLGMFRMATGLGGLLSPILGSMMYALGGFFATFATIGFVYLLIIPVVYFKLNEAFIQYNQLEKAI